MSGVWREQSIPMVDRACALEAFAAIGGHVTTASSSMLQVQMNGQDWTVRHVNGRYSVRYNARGGVRPTWFAKLSKAYEAAYAAKLQRLKAEEERATAEHERAALIEERRQMEAQRLELIQTRREEILQRAKAMGYRVMESKTNGQIRLVLVRNG